VRIGRCEFSARLFRRLCRRCLVCGRTYRMAGGVTRELVSDHDTRLRSVLAVEHLTQESLGSLLITSALYQDVEHNAVLLNGSPKPMAFATDLQQDLVEMPLVAGSSSRGAV